MLMCGLLLVAGVTAAMLPTAFSHCEALNGVQLTAEVKELKRQLASCHGTVTCPPTTRTRK
ncbi:hypothetical protein BaRGS_00035321, partial [Batillaria attramentaria]